MLLFELRQQHMCVTVKKERLTLMRMDADYKNLPVFSYSQNWCATDSFTCRQIMVQYLVMAIK